MILIVLITCYITSYLNNPVLRYITNYFSLNIVLFIDGHRNEVRKFHDSINFIVFYIMLF